MVNYPGRQYAYYENYTLRLTEIPTQYLHAAESELEKEIRWQQLCIVMAILMILLLTLCIFLPMFTLYHWATPKIIKCTTRLNSGWSALLSISKRRNIY